MLAIERYALTNKLHNRHPAERGCLALLYLTACLLARSPDVPFLILVIMAVFTVLAVRIPLRVYLGLLTVPSFFLVFGLLTMAISLDPPAACVYELSLLGHRLGLTPEGLTMAAQTFWRSLGAMSCMFFFILTTPVTEILAMLGRIPFPALLLEIMILVYSSITVLLDTASKIFLAQSARLGYNSAKNTYRSLSWLVANLFVQSLRRSRDMYLGLSARGYEDGIRFVQPAKPLSLPFLILASASGLLLIFFALRTGGLTF